MVPNMIEWHDSQRQHWYDKARALMPSRDLSIIDVLRTGSPRAKTLVRIGMRHSIIAHRMRQGVDWESPYKITAPHYKRRLNYPGV